MAEERRIEIHDVESLLRSLAMAPLAEERIEAILTQHRALLAERAQIEALLHQLSPAWSQARAVLNQLHHLLHSDPDGQGHPAAGGC